MIPWLEAVNRDSNGAVEIKYFGGGVLGNAGNTYDSVLTGAAEFRGIMPFLAADFVKLALLVAFPLIALWLPATMR